MKSSLVLASVAVMAATLTACGGDEADSAYCKDLKAASAQFDSLSSSDLSQLDKAFATFHELNDQAPSDIEPEWKVLDDGITKVETALEEAGLEFADFAEIQEGNMPEGVDVAKLQGLASEFSELNSGEFEAASTKIETHAKDVCKVDLSAS